MTWEGRPRLNYAKLDCAQRLVILTTKDIIIGKREWFPNFTLRARFQTRCGTSGRIFRVIRYAAGKDKIGRNKAREVTERGLEEADDRNSLGPYKGSGSFSPLHSPKMAHVGKEARKKNKKTKR